MVLSMKQKQRHQSAVQLKPRLHIHGFLYDSPRFIPISNGQRNRGESWRKVEIFSVTTIPVRMSTILVRCLLGIATNQ